MQGEEGALSLTTKGRSPDSIVKGRPLNYCAGFRPQKGAELGNGQPEGKANNLAPYGSHVCSKSVNVDSSY